MATPGPGLTARFRQDLEAALGVPAEDARIALAVSGGPDSMAMLALAHAALPGGVIAATVDHGLRPAAAMEAAMVASHCAAAAIPHRTLTLESPPAGASVQARAREARYAALFAWAGDEGAAALATAHHADDQAETLLMRAARGSGLPGLAAIRERREHMAGCGAAMLLVRPLLNWRRDELRAIAEDCDLPFVHDPSNADDSFDRTRFRRMLEANRWLDVGNIARCAAHLAEAERALIAAVDMLWDDRAAIEGAAVTLDPRDLPRELLRRLVRNAIGHVRAAAPDAEGEWNDAANIEPLLDALEAGRGATQAGVQASARRGSWHFRPAPPRRSP
ncbi:tRNA lysidine(34) synthetase TilS [Sphingomonas canadensis]|uniref:tRNA(Ile)-lysidine synthase n=1 Tax=Sphingomonas canadensis TaxID=1219257 RepID=A0ABW3H435_9SPHN|nr:tRNA lysidine(34) synthetase TilS [Sphingomonas canadensis]MCW3834645.1 tRNA lysidine(34) synthetase TilS [Sphingomonas canadensis]